VFLSPPNRQIDTKESPSKAAWPHLSPGAVQLTLRATGPRYTEILST